MQTFSRSFSILVSVLLTSLPTNISKISFWRNSLSYILLTGFSCFHAHVIYSDFSTCEVHPDLECGVLPEDYTSYDCYQQDTGCLFDIESDPCEYYDVGEQYADVRASMIDRLDEYVNIMPRALIHRGNELNESVYTPQDGALYWAPFMRYDSVIFEHALSEYYRELFPDTETHESPASDPAEEPAKSEDENAGFPAENEGLFWRFFEFLKIWEILERV